jgi:hypothetical protein
MPVREGTVEIGLNVKESSTKSERKVSGVGMQDGTRKCGSPNFECEQSDVRKAFTIPNIIKLRRAATAKHIHFPIDGKGNCRTRKMIDRSHPCEATRCL